MKIFSEKIDATDNSIELKELKKTILTETKKENGLTYVNYKLLKEQIEIKIEEKNTISDKIEKKIPIR
jgi:hypothetical protein